MCSERDVLRIRFEQECDLAMRRSKINCRHWFEIAADDARHNRSAESILTRAEQIQRRAFRFERRRGDLRDVRDAPIQATIGDAGTAFPFALVL